MIDLGRIAYALKALAHPTANDIDNRSLSAVYYNNVWWCPLGTLSRDDLDELIFGPNKDRRTYLQTSRPDASHALESGSVYLSIAFRQTRRLNREEFGVILNTLLICPPALQVRINQQEQSNRLLQKYCTTQLYTALFCRHEQLYPEKSEFKVPARFQPTLRNYQRRTVGWLLRREQQPQKMPNFSIRLTSKGDCNKPIYVHSYCRLIQNTEPMEEVLPPGGILADEMGLGKTVELIALILLHPCPSISPLTHVNSADSDEDSIPLKRRKKVIDLFCVCPTKTTKDVIYCTRCKRAQHTACVTSFNAEHNSDINEPYRCPKCWYEIMKDGPPIATGATFIVTPPAIIQQWQLELQRHVQPPLRVHIYKGISGSNGSWISPLQLAAYDVVLTDYTVLRNEFNLIPQTSSRITRHQPRYMRKCTPLLWLRWWRVCLDEAQMIESNVSHAAELVRQLPAVNRWAVTGTPISRSLDDLCPLLRFIGFAQAIEMPEMWPTLVSEFLHHQAQPTRNEVVTRSGLIDDVLQLCMWRTCKTQAVLDELGIPPQRFRLHRIQLSNLERLFYGDQHSICAGKFELGLRQLPRQAQEVQNDSILLSITPRILNRLLHPLFGLRQCCNIPLGVRHRGNTLGQAVQQRHFMQPKELHAYLKAENIRDCKSALRNMASSYNGMAGIHFLEQRYSDAMQYYERTLQLAAEYKELPYCVDSLLQIHALHNYLQAHRIGNHSSTAVNTVGAEEQIAQYETQLCELEVKYLLPYATEMRNKQSTYEAAYAAYQRADAKTEKQLQDFLADALAMLSDTTEEHDAVLIQRISEDCFPLFSGKTSSLSVEAICSQRGMLFVIVGWCDKLQSSLKTLVAKVQQLQTYTVHMGAARHQVEPRVWREMKRFFTDVYDCHLSHVRVGMSRAANPKSNETKKLCELCELQAEHNKYECLLFNKTIDETTNAIEGIDSPSAELTLVKTIFANLRTSSLRRRLLADIDAYAAVLESLQSLSKHLSQYWIEIEYTVKAYDELDMCKMRLMLRDDNSDDDNEERNPIWRINALELAENMQQQNMQLQQSKDQFRLKLGRLKYIMHLEANTDPGVCPICHTNADECYIVMDCGHHICLPCLNSLRQYRRSLEINCAICRNTQSLKKIHYVVRDSSNGLNEQLEPIQVLGNYSTKILYITRLILLQLQEHSQGRQSEMPKILVFSQWEPILKALAAALGENHIKHRFYTSTRCLDEFKDDQLGITCLLMTLGQGSKGLNLVEANTVFLVEPIINPGQELQAIGRVHRFGQTKATTVHRFIVRNTVEDNIFNVVAKNASSQPNWEFNNISLCDLRDLFKLEEVGDIF